MAKHKKQNRAQASQAERGQQQAQQTAMEAEAKRATTASPMDMARKHRERRFGHN
ncbi:hypothetical protein ACSCBZ_30565 [Streptomyces niveiscabiei]|uniref:Small hydrophilic protein n=1 Tax=Streptomyces niveiscabiei TaxID=164115 RepID=A0ABW9HTM2_9ACTN|nr:MULTISPECIES: hypothetical protein [Streptomyces]MDX3381281.1 hypothetical protein [Streptomyces niveiscabiei]QZZ27289.1 hypothetical protein A7X85_14325 [Streptomyces sp. ST1015]